MVKRSDKRATATATLVRLFQQANAEGLAEFTFNESAEQIARAVDDIVDAALEEGGTYAAEDEATGVTAEETADLAGDPVRCGQKDCLQWADYSYVWPSNATRLYVCKTHVQHLRGVSSAMGVYVDLRSMPSDGGGEDESKGVV